MAEHLREEEQARVCSCGHSAFWHGEHGCEDNLGCKCGKFVLDRIETIAELRNEIKRLLTPPEDGPRKRVVWLCAGCEDCEPSDGSAPSKVPCRDSPSADGAVVVLAEDYDTMARINSEREAELRRLAGRSTAL